MKPNIPELEAQLNSATDKQTKIRLLNELSWAVILENQEKARALSEQAHKLSISGEFDGNPHLPGVVGYLRSFAALNNDDGNYDLALSQSLQALDILNSYPFNEDEKNKMLMDVMGNISWTYRCLGDYITAADYGAKEYSLAQEIGDIRHEAGALNILSVIYAEANDLQTSLEMSKKVLQCYREIGYTRGESIVLNNMALTHLEMGDSEQALQIGQESLRIARDFGIEAVELSVLGTLGEIHLGMKEYDDAEKYLLQALTMSREKKSRPEEFLSLLNLGKVHQAAEREKEALSALRIALKISQASNNRLGESQCHQIMSEVLEKQKKFKEALKHFKEFHTLKETVFNENTAKKLAGLQVAHQLETAKKDAELHYLKTIELNREIEERKVTQEALEKLASIDPLTGTLNRREFFIQGEHEVKLALESNRPLTAILFDLDHFKSINDTYGHAAGDQVLIHVTKWARESLRQGEIIGRYGGDEFVILLLGSASAQAQQVGERLCEKVALHPVATEVGPIAITISLGIAELTPTAPPSLETLLAHADQALYVAKHAGRGQIAVYDQAQTKFSSQK